jgi:hypothetical protein
MSRGTGTHSSSGDDSVANSEFEGDGKVSADGEQGQDDEEDQVEDEVQDEVHENQGGANESAYDEEAAQRSPSIETNKAQLRNPDIAIPAASASSRRVSGLIPPHVLHATTSTTGIS